MVTMEPFKAYEYLVVARGRVLDWTRTQSREEYEREFPMGLVTLGRTLTHIMASEWYYVMRMEGKTVPRYDEWPIRHENPPPFVKLEAAWTEQAGRTRAAIGAVRDWKKELEYQVTDDDGREIIVTASASDIFTQLVLHEVHHRAQAMNMLRQLGVKVEDIDYNALMYKRRPAL